MKVEDTNVDRRVFLAAAGGVALATAAGSANAKTFSGAAYSELALAARECSASGSACISECIADLRNESLNKRIRDNQKKYVPYMLVVGEREETEGTVSIRRRDGLQLREGMKLELFAEELLEEVGRRDLELSIGSEPEAGE